MHQSRPAVDAAVRFLRAGVRRGVFRAGERLPTILELARQAGVGKISMARGVHVLVKEGLLDARRKRGIVLARGRREPAPVARAPSKAEGMTQDIAKKLLAGAYGPSHVLPSLKELSAFYGAGFRGVKRAIESLKREGIVVPHGRGYRLHGPAPGPRPKTLVLIVGKDMQENLGFSYARSFFYPLLYALERDCGQRNVRLEVERFPWRMHKLVRKSGTLAHFVLLDAEPDAPTIQLIAHLVTLGAPALVFRDGAHEAFEALPASKNLVFFECNHPAAGLHVGRYLLALGHRRVAYLRRAPPERWSVGRLAGLTRAFEGPGVRSGVRVIDVGTLGDAPPGRKGQRTVAEWDRTIASLVAMPAITAWVASDDHLVIDRIVPALQRRGMALAEAASIVSFNDQEEAFGMGLTSFNFNSPGVAAAVLSHAAVPAALRRTQRGKHPVVEIEGYLADRGSVRAVGR
jgi:DNA-binding GntR family transcriptional regulator